MQLFCGHSHSMFNSFLSKDLVCSCMMVSRNCLFRPPDQLLLFWEKYLAHTQTCASLYAVSSLYALYFLSILGKLDSSLNIHLEYPLHTKSFSDSLPLVNISLSTFSYVCIHGLILHYIWLCFRLGISSRIISNRIGKGHTSFEERSEFV